MTITRKKKSEKSEKLKKKKLDFNLLTSWIFFKIKFFFFTFFKFTWKIGNRLIRKKNQFSDFSDYYFSSYGHFSVLFLKKSPQFSRSIQNIPHHS